MNVQGFYDIFKMGKLSLYSLILKSFLFPKTWCQSSLTHAAADSGNTDNKCSYHVSYHLIRSITRNQGVLVLYVVHNEYKAHSLKQTRPTHTKQRTDTTQVITTLYGKDIKYYINNKVPFL